MRLARVAFCLLGTVTACSGARTRAAPATATTTSSSGDARAARASTPCEGAPDFAAIAERAARGVVRIVVSRNAPVEAPSGGGRPESVGLPSEGSGVVVAAGVVATSSHVVRDATRVDAILPDGRAVGARVVAVDDPTDLAVLRLAGDASGTVPLEWAAAAPRLGEPVLVVGNALGAGMAVSRGIVSATGRSGLGHAQYEDYVLTDARVARGSSGGALVDVDGHLVGIDAGIFVDGPAGAAFGLAVSARLARPVVERLAEGRAVSRGDIGVDVADLEPARAADLGFGGVDGAVVTTVEPGSPAERSGLRPGDVVVSANGWAVLRRGHFRAALSLVDSGVPVPVVLYRAGQRLELVLTPGSRGPGAGGLTPPPPSGVAPRAAP